jgi:hypothetical protein
MLAFTRCQQTCSVSRRVYKHFPQLLFIFYFVFQRYIAERGDAENFNILTYFFRPHQNFLHCPLFISRDVLFIKTTSYDRETSFLSHSFTEMGQRKKIIDDHDKLCSEIEISKLLSNNRIFQHRYQFQQYIIDVCTNFSEVI